MEAGKIREVFERGKGILKLIPNFIVHKRFNIPGHRLRLHPDDYYPYGTAAGSVMERWFSSVNSTRTDHPVCENEGMSYVSYGKSRDEKFLFKEAVDVLKDELIGGALYEKYGTWPMFSKFFDYGNPLFFHFHPDDKAAANIGCNGKPECYYFPPQYNDNGGALPITYMGFEQGVTKEEIRKRLMAYTERDTRITELSRAYRLELGTGWYLPAGVLHAPGSYLTYEPQWNSDVNCVFENIVCNDVYDTSYLYDCCPKDVENPIDYIMSIVDWEKNFDPQFKQHYFRPAVEIKGRPANVCEKWICYGNDFVTAKEVTLAPESEGVITDKAAYGCVLTQGHGKFGTFNAESVQMLRFGSLSADEFFVSQKAANAGVRVVNESCSEPLVFLQHYASDNPIYI